MTTNRQWELFPLSITRTFFNISKWVNTMGYIIALYSFVLTTTIFRLIALYCYRNAFYKAITVPNFIFWSFDSPHGIFCFNSKYICFDLFRALVPFFWFKLLVQNILFIYDFCNYYVIRKISNFMSEHFEKNHPATNKNNKSYKKFKRY